MKWVALARTGNPNSKHLMYRKTVGVAANMYLAFLLSFYNLIYACIIQSQGVL